MHKLPENFQVFFWDTNINRINPETHKFYIIERLLNEGNEKTLAWLFTTYDLEEIKAVVCKSRRLTLKTAYCWKNYFGLEKRSMRCFGKSWTKEETRFLKR